MPFKGIGRQIQIGTAVEVVRGTAVTPPAYWHPYAEFAVEEKIENAQDITTVGVIEEGVSETQVKAWVEGTIKGNVRDQSFGHFLLSLFGTDTPVAKSGGNSSVFDHTFTVRQAATHKSLTLTKHDVLAGQDYSYANAVVHKLEIEYSLKKFLQYTASVVAQKGAKISTQVPFTDIVENYFAAPHLTFKMAGTVAGLAGAAAIQLKNAKVTIDANIEHDEVLGQLAPADFLGKSFKVDMTLEAIWQNESDFLSTFIAVTPQAFLLDMKNTNVTLGASANPEFQILLASQSYITELSKPSKVGDLVMQMLKVRGNYSLSDAYMIKAILTNTIANTGPSASVSPSSSISPSASLSPSISPSASLSPSASRSPSSSASPSV